MPRRSTAIAVAIGALAIGLGAGVPAAGAATLKAHGSIKQAYVVGAKKAQRVVLRDASGRTVAAGRSDRFGSKIFRDIRPGRGYSVLAGKRKTRPFKVLRPGQNPKRSFYKGQTLKQGLNYVKMRDGVELAMTVRLPAGKKLSDGPFPTFIEYSGYQTAAPNDLFASVVDQLTTGAPADPLAPASSTAVGSLIGPLLGFAVVSVQMRGSGCSGGAFDLFDLPTTYDGYDAVEAVAAQKWVKGGKVGMGGISFSGITQLFVAGTQPPHLAAISPMSVSDDLYTATGYPGGIFNSGFAKTWVQERMDDAKPAPAGGQPYARVLTKQGDKHCIANQKLRLQTQDALEIQKQNPFRTPSLFSQRAPGPWLKHAKVPVFLVGQFQDEQTGGHFAESIKNLNKNPNVWVTLQNGVHADSLGPSSITRWAEFMKLYVADEIPVIPQPVIDLSGALYQYLADAGAAPVEQSRFAGMTRRRRRQGHLQEGSSRTGADGQRRRPAGAGLDRRYLGARLQRVAAEARRGRRATTWARTERSARSPAERGLGVLHGGPERAPQADASGRRGGGRVEGAAALSVGADRGRQGPRVHIAGRSPPTS